MTDMEMLQRLSAGAGSLETYVDLCVKEAKALGYDFTAAEATDYVSQFVETAKKGELSDVQLELVAGGKGQNPQGGMPAGPQGGMPAGPQVGMPAGQQGGKGVAGTGPQGGMPAGPQVSLPPVQTGGKGGR
jgi:hypothetical protein